MASDGEVGVGVGMTIRAHISEGPFGNEHLKVFLVDQREDMPKRLLLKDGDFWRWVELDSAQAIVAEPVDPTFELPWDSGRALLDALMNHYRGAEDTRALRRDYDAERKRVDALTTTISDCLRAINTAAARTI